MNDSEIYWFLLALTSTNQMFLFKDLTFNWRFLPHSTTIKSIKFYVKVFIQVFTAWDKNSTRTENLIVSALKLHRMPAQSQSSSRPFFSTHLLCDLVSLMQVQRESGVLPFVWERKRKKVDTNIVYMHISR